MCVCVCIYVCIYVCVYICVCIYICVFVCVYVCVCVFQCRKMDEIIHHHITTLSITPQTLHNLNSTMLELSSVFYIISHYYSKENFKRNSIFFKLWSNDDTFNCSCIFVSNNITQMMTGLLAETCCWKYDLQYVIKSKCLRWLFVRFMGLIIWILILFL